MPAQRQDRIAAVVSIALLATLTAYSYYLTELARRDDPAAGARPPAHEPDYFVERFSLTRTDRQGEPTFRLWAERAVHFPDDDSSEFTQPRLVSLDPTRPRVTLTAREGRTTGRGEQTLLKDEVRVVREAGPEAPALRLSTEALTVFSETETARTDLPVRIERGGAVLTGVGMEFDNRWGTLQLRERVQVHWPPGTGAGQSPRQASSP
jgi:lipopolysaccharide export system protein LptC